MINANQFAISVQQVGKCYRINEGVERGGYRTLRDTLADAAKSLARNLRNRAALGTVNDFWALKNVSFDVREGEILGIVGRNGAGKSTLLKLLTRITRPTRGKATLRGRVGSLLEVGTGFHPELTGRENVFLNGSILGMQRREIVAKFDQIVAFSGVEKFIDTPVKRYSSGMRVRLAFAVAAHLDLEILLIDEVLAVGDAEFQRRCLGKMGDVANSGRTVLFVSHNLAALQNLCPRSILLDRGQIEMDGPSDEVIQQYMSAFSTTAGDADLSHPDVRRSGTGPARFESIELLAADGTSTSTLPMGAGCTIRARLRSPQDIERANISFALFNQDGTRLCNLHGHDMQKFSFALRANQVHQIDCAIPRFNLTPGIYTLSLMLPQHRQPPMDYVEHAVSFEVLAHDIYNTGRIPAASATVFFEGVWSESAGAGRAVKR